MQVCDITCSHVVIRVTLDVEIACDESAKRAFSKQKAHNYSVGYSVGDNYSATSSISLYNQRVRMNASDRMQAVLRKIHSKKVSKDIAK